MRLVYVLFGIGPTTVKVVLSHYGPTDPENEL